MPVIIGIMAGEMGRTRNGAAGTGLEWRVFGEGAEVAIDRGARWLRAHRGQWQDLCDEAAGPNVFFEPLCLPALIDGLDHRHKVSVAVMRDGADRRLLGIVPFTIERRFLGLPLPVLRVWENDHVLVSDPLLAESRAEEALAAFFAFADSRFVAGVEFTFLTTTGRVADAVSAVCADRRRFVIDEFERAAIDAGARRAEDIEAALSSERRRSLRRRRRKLERKGELSYVAIGPDDDAGAWFDEFCEIEDRGWKGSEGTSLVKSGLAPMYREIVAAAHAGGSLCASTLALDSRPLAMLFDIVACAGGVGFSLKTAYDEDFREYSPGIILEVEHAMRMCGEPSVMFVDSCTDYENEMLNALWPDGKPMQSVLYATSGAFGRSAVSGLAGLRRVRRRFIGSNAE